MSETRVEYQMDNTLTVPETTRLSDLETVIEHGLQTFVEVGNALMEIRDGRLYRESCDTFEDYCRERWGMSKRYVNYQIQASEVIKNLGTIVPKNELPQTESQARPLSGLTPQLQREVWPLVVDTAPNGKITANHVQSVVNDFNYKRDTRRSVAADIYTPQGMDACQTPAYAVDPLLPYLAEGWNIWEPACGEGLLEDALIDSGYHVVSGDILTGQNFFDYEPESWDVIITNPPYSIQFQWLKRCYELGKPFALLLKVEVLGTKGAQELMEQYGFEILLLDKRVDFKMPNLGWGDDDHKSSAQFPTFWLCWQLLPERIKFGKLNKKNDNPY